jgi:hypothetical protein
MNSGKKWGLLDSVQDGLEEILSKTKNEGVKK